VKAKLVAGDFLVRIRDEAEDQIAVLCLNSNSDIYYYICDNTPVMLTGTMIDMI
jgi:predicted transcriptional regulator YheO